MENYLRFLLSLTLLFLSSQVVRVNDTRAQAVTMMPNPDNGGGYTDRFNQGSFEPLVEMDNALYGRYVDARHNGRLVKFDGTRLTLISNPDSSPGVFGNMIAYNHAIYVQYSAGGIMRLAKYDGKNLTLLDNPDAGLGFYGGSVLTVFNNGLYGRYLDANDNFHLVRVDHPSTDLSFAFMGVTGVSCTTGSGNQRTVKFTPQYTGVTGQSITFSVVGELLPTTNSGPYTLNMYRDNPVITLKAIQAGTPGEATYLFNWASFCPLGARLAADEGLSVTVIPNPSVGQTTDIEVKGVANQPVDFQVTDEQGKPVSQFRIEQANDVERVPVRLGSLPGIYMLRVITPLQRKTVKLIKK